MQLSDIFGGFKMPRPTPDAKLAEQDRAERLRLVQLALADSGLSVPTPHRSTSPHGRNGYAPCRAAKAARCRFGNDWLCRPTQDENGRHRPRVAPAIHDAFRRMLDRLDQGACMLVTAPTGTGKSLGAAALFAAIWDDVVRNGGDDWREVERLSHLRLVETAKVLKAWRSHPLGRGMPESIRSWMSCRVLVLDEMGRVPDNADTDLFELINDRSKAGRTTIGLAGYPADERHGERYPVTVSSVLGREVPRRLAERRLGGELVEVGW